MGAAPATAVVEDLRFRDHRGPAGHPEHPERLAAVQAALDARSEPLDRLSPRPATVDEVTRVHSREHFERISEAVRQAPTQLDPDTYVSPQSLEVALLAAGGSIDLARRVARGEARSGLAAVRPPGHHAEAGHAMGFCLFNNVAIAARALQHDEGLERVLIFDWDVHHGNGTQHSFDDDPTVFYASTHQFPYYPGTGDATEAGIGRGSGATLNIPMPAGCGDAEYIGALQRLLVPAAQAFRPELLLVSCGFDAHRDDPLAAMEVSGDGFRSMARIVRALAEDLCGGRVVFVLEGGYAATGLREGTEAVLDALLEESPAALPPVDPQPGRRLESVIERVVAVHRGRIPDLGVA
jgi:acetoin utilization deacetylase AcuC-like enzyme